MVQRGCSSGAAHGNLPGKLLDLEFWAREGGAERWEALLGEGEDPGSLRSLRRCTYAGRPFGEEAFLRAMEQRFHRQWRRGSFADALFPQKTAAPGQKSPLKLGIP
jgi:hypothetical protein